MRIAFLTPSLHHGGAERWILSLARHFATAKPAGCLLLSQHCHRAVLAEARRLMPVVACREPPKSDQLVDEAREHLSRMAANADCFLAWGIPGLQQLRRDLDVPIIDVSHASAEWPNQRKLLAATCTGADYLAAVSGVAAAAYPTAMHSAVSVIYNGVEADRVAPRAGRRAKRVELGIDRSEKVLLFLGRFCDEKRPWLLLDALDHLPAEWHALFVGHGPLESELREQAHGRHGARTRFLPSTPEIGDLLAAADCLMLPSRYEGMPLVLLEAWLAGLPTVCTRFGFIEEIERQHGSLCETVELEAPHGDALAAAVLRAGEQRCVDLARRTVWQHYTAGAMAQRWEAYLAAVVEHYQRTRTIDNPVRRLA